VEVKFCMFNEVFHMVFLVTTVSIVNNFIPTFTKPDIFTFVNNSVSTDFQLRNSHIRAPNISSHN
jgi:hypothetical protein